MDFASLFLLYFLVRNTLTFNLDVENTVLEFSGADEDSFFGASVAFANISGKRIVIGAPFGGRKKIGTVYVCGMDQKCEELAGLKNRKTTEDEDRNNRHFLGMCLSASDDYLLVGAPGYKGYALLFDQHGHKFQEYKLERSRVDLPDTFIMTGFSTAITSSNNRPVFFLGIPGSKRDIGRLYTIYNFTEKFESPLFEVDANAYLGYSISVAHFYPEYKKANPAIVAGAPSNRNFVGSVHFITVDTKSKTIRDGRRRYKEICKSIHNPDEQIGSYFGASVCAVDLNNDKKDDILVGAPLHSIVRDEGRVYVYIHVNTQDCYHSNTYTLLEGKTVGGRFGITITSIGDINRDGYPDVAIGAPYGGPDGHGAVYIYNGGANGIQKNPSQEIFSRDMPNGGGIGFGYSIAGGLDIDENKYSDIIIGAHEASKVFLIRSRPIIQINSSIEFSRDFVPAYPMLILNCGVPKLTSHNCIKMLVKLEYEGNAIPDNISLEVSIELDFAKNTGKRAAFISNQQSHMILPNVLLQKNLDVPLVFNISIVAKRTTDIETPIKVRMMFRDSPCPTNTVCPIIKQEEILDTHEIGYTSCFYTSCAHKFNISSSLQSPRNILLKKVVYGRTSTVYYVLHVAHVEEGYLETLTLSFHSDLTMDAILVDDEIIPVEDEDEEITESNIKQLNISLRLVITKNINHEIEVRFSFPKQLPTTDSYKFSASINEFRNNTGGINFVESEVDVVIEACIIVSADAKPGFYQYGQDSDLIHEESPEEGIISDEMIGREMKYTFYVQNMGRVPVENLMANVIIPVKKDNYNFMYVSNLTVDGYSCTNNFTVESNQIFNCSLDRIERNKGVKILMTTRLWSRNLAKIGFQGDLEVPITVSFEDKDWYVENDETNCTLDAVATISIRQSKKKEINKPLSPWIPILSAVGSLVMLFVAVLILYKCGFFERDKRKINKDSEEIQEPVENNFSAEDDEEDRMEYDEDYF